MYAPHINQNHHHHCRIIVPEDTEVDKWDDDHVEAAKQDVDDAGGVVGWQVHVGARVEEICLILTLLNNLMISSKK